MSITRLWIQCLAAVLVFLAGCSTPRAGSTPLAASPVPGNEEGFAIYLTADNLSVQQMTASHLNEVRLTDAPIISPTDILAYNKDNHEIELTPEARLRLEQLQVPTSGVPFIACVNRRPVYWGAFWTPFSSASFSGVVIQGPFTGSRTSIRIELGYPGVTFFEGEDPRSASQVLEALEMAGKLG